MLRKLLKYELMYLVKDFTRTYIFYAADILILALLVGIGNSGAGGTAYVTLLGIFGVIYYVFTLILAMLTITHNVKRFKKNMFSHEGYLTNTLPVTPAQHVIAKVIIGAVNYVASFVIIYLGMLLLSACSGEIETFRKVMEFAFNFIGDIGLLVPTFLMLATGYLALLLCCYMVTSIGSMIGASKGGSAAIGVGLAAAYIFVTSMLNSVMVDGGVSPKGILYIYSFFYALCAVGEFFIVTYIIKNKLNLQ